MSELEDKRAEQIKAIDDACKHGKEHKASGNDKLFGIPKGFCFKCFPEKLNIYLSDDLLIAELAKRNYVAYTFNNRPMFDPQVINVKNGRISFKDE